MGKGTDKLYITHSEWSSSDAFSANSGSGTKTSSSHNILNLPFTRLPYNFCSLSLQPFTTAVCTPSGQIFDPIHILPYLHTHSNTNPLDGTPLLPSALIKLHFTKNATGEYIDPVTHKVFTENTHIVAIKPTGNVFSWDTVERLNVKGKHWRDLVDEEVEFGRSDIIQIQDPREGGKRDLGSFKFLRDGERVGVQEKGGVNLGAMGSAAKVLKAKEAVERARKGREDPNRNPALHKGGAGAVVKAGGGLGVDKGKGAGYAGYQIPYNAAQHTTGKAAASFTSTGLTPHTSGERALLTDEEYMLRPKRVKNKGYARIQTNLGDVNVELQTEYAPRAVWNFVQLAKKGYYKGVEFHRNIRNFMIQGGDPTGTGKGGTSIWGKNFNDEFDGPLTHDARGMLSMANKGKNTNSSQFFITYRPAKHLDRKHTIFGRAVGGLETLTRLENAPVGEGDRPTDPITITDVIIFVDPFEEFLKEKKEKDDAEKEKLEIKRKGGTEDEKMTWTGKRVRKDGAAEGAGGAESLGVGKYLKAAQAGGEEDEILGEWDDAVEEPVKKKPKGGGGFGNFDSW